MTPIARSVMCVRPDEDEEPSVRFPIAVSLDFAMLSRIEELWRTKDGGSTVFISSNVRALTKCAGGRISRGGGDTVSASSNNGSIIGEV